MQGLHAEILGFLHPSNPISRSTIISLYPRSIDPDAIHKAIFELTRSGVAIATQKGLVLAKPPKDDDSQDREACKENGIRAGNLSAATRNKLKAANIPRTDPDGRRWCNHCEQYLDPTRFNRSADSPDGLYTTCRICRNASRADSRKKRIALYNPIGHRYCSHCDSYRNPNQFFADATAKDGLYRWCRSCVAARRKERSRVA